MMVYNKTKEKLVAQHVTVAGSIFARMKGLLGKKCLKDGEGMYFEPCSSIHTLFMKFPIDVLFIDKGNIVIHIIKTLKPFRFSGVYINAKACIELASGVVDLSSTEVGDTLLLK